MGVVEDTQMFLLGRVGEAHGALLRCKMGLAQTSTVDKCFHCAGAKSQQSFARAVMTWVEARVEHVLAGELAGSTRGLRSSGRWRFATILMAGK